MIYKNLSEFRDIDEASGIIKGYANVYNVKDSDGDISLPGSFSKTVAERAKMIKIFKNHSPQLVGVTLEDYLSRQWGQLDGNVIQKKERFFSLRMSRLIFCHSSVCFSVSPLS